MLKVALLEGLVRGMKRVWFWALVAEYNILMRLQALLPVGRLRFIIAGRAFMLGVAACESVKERHETSY